MGGFYMPTPGDVHVNTPLTNISVGWVQEATDFIATRAFPIIPVSKQGDRYYVYKQEDFYRDQMQIRGAGAEAATIGYGLDNTPTYFAEPYALNKPVPDQVRANADAVLNMDMDATFFLTQLALIKREKIFGTNAFTTGKWGKDVTGVASGVSANQFLQWNDPSSTPIEDIRVGKLYVKQNTGYQANVLVLSEPVWAKLQDHPDIVDRVKAGQTPGGPAMVTRQAVAAILELDELLVMGAVENTAPQGQTGTFNFIGGKSALLIHRTKRAGLMVPTAGYTFAWTGLFGASAEGNRIKRYRWEIKSSDMIECEMAIDMKIIATNLGYFFATAVA
jgi:hypothetical protein